jgi:DNA-binding transcriptional MerR regulator
MAPTTLRTFTISELAKEFDITTRTIRFYEDMGLLKPQRRGQSRIFSPGDRTTIKLILRGKRLGFSLLESKEMIELYDPAEGNVTQLETLLGKLAEKRAVLDRQLEDIRVMQLELDDVERRCRDALTATRAKRTARAARPTAKKRAASTANATKPTKPTKPTTPAGKKR